MSSEEIIIEGIKSRRKTDGVKAVEEMQARLREFDKIERANRKGKLGGKDIKIIPSNESPIADLTALHFPRNLSSK